MESSWRPDHYAPTKATGTLLVRGPYGRGFPFSLVYAAIYAARGYHVILQSARGTFGSQGAFEPVVNEAADGADTVAWLRRQPWFTGRFATIGMSYLGLTQWAILEDPPPELAAAVIIGRPARPQCRGLAHRLVCAARRAELVRCCGPPRRWRAGANADPSAHSAPPHQPGSSRSAVGCRRSGATG